LTDDRSPRATAATSSDVYRHTQFGTVIAVGTVAGLVLAVVLTFSLSLATFKAAWWMVVALFGVIVAAFLVFAQLTVEVDERETRLRFGIGLIRKTVQLADILRCDRVRTRIWWGWGLHWTPSGWLYNVAGRDAVRLELASGRAVIIGSDDAEALQQAIDARRTAAVSRAKEGQMRERG
jgi:hypothetical protein